MFLFLMSLACIAGLFAVAYGIDRFIDSVFDIEDTEA